MTRGTNWPVVGRGATPRVASREGWHGAMNEEQRCSRGLPHRSSAVVVAPRAADRRRGQRDGAATAGWRAESAWRVAGRRTRQHRRPPTPATVTARWLDGRARPAGELTPFAVCGRVLPACLDGIRTSTTSRRVTGLSMSASPRILRGGSRSTSATTEKAVTFPRWASVLPKRPLWHGRESKRQTVDPQEGRPERGRRSSNPSIWRFCYK